VTGVSATAVTVTWNASTDPTVTGYDVYQKVWIPPVHDPRGSGGSPGHWVENLVTSGVTTTSVTFGSLAPGESRTYNVTAVNPSGQSQFSMPASGQTWFAAVVSSGPNTLILSDGAPSNGPVGVTAGITDQVTPLMFGNPVTFSVVSGPSNAIVNPKDGVVTFTPSARQVGVVNVTIEASDPLGSVTQTIQFDVVAAIPGLLKPTIKLASHSAPYNGMIQGVSATAYEADGVTPVAGAIQVAYNGGSFGPPLSAGTYQVLLTFTSANPAYANATLLTTFTLTRARPTIRAVPSQTIAYSTATTTFTGTIGGNSSTPAGQGEYIDVTLNGVTNQAPINTNGTFTTSFDTSALPAGAYRVTYGYPGDSNFTAAPAASSTLKVLPLVAPVVTLNPTNVTVTAGDGVVLTAAATGTPVPSVVWQVSTDGGRTFTDITSNASALTPTLIFIASAAENGYEYHAVFTNPAGIAVTRAAVLTVQSDTGGSAATPVILGPNLAYDPFGEKPSSGHWN
jgi:hypothetical protein